MKIKQEYCFSTSSIADSAVFYFFHKNFVDYCKENFCSGTFHLFFREGENGIAFFEHDGNIISEERCACTPFTAP